LSRPKGVLDLTLTLTLTELSRPKGVLGSLEILWRAGEVLQLITLHI